MNAIAPGFVSGRMAKAFSDEEKAVILSELPQQRMIAPQEVAHVCAYLCHLMLRVLQEQSKRLMVVGIFKKYPKF